MTYSRQRLIGFPASPLLDEEDIVVLDHNSQRRISSKYIFMVPRGWVPTTHWHFLVYFPNVRMPVWDPVCSPLWSVVFKQWSWSPGCESIQSFKMVLCYRSMWVPVSRGHLPPSSLDTFLFLPVYSRSVSFQGNSHSQSCCYWKILNSRDIDVMETIGVWWFLKAQIWEQFWWAAAVLLILG